MAPSDTESTLLEISTHVSNPFSIAAGSAALTIPIAQCTRNLDSRKPVGFVRLPRRKRISTASQTLSILSQDEDNRVEATQKVEGNRWLDGDPI